LRTAAASHGARVVGVLLSGLLDDGSLGLSAVKACGGVALVQDPAEARCPDMPRNALRNVGVDRGLPLAEIARALERLAHEPAGGAAPAPPEGLEFEAAIAA